MMIENALQIEHSSRDTILAILREADDHWNVASHHRISTRPTKLELVIRHCDVEQTNKILKCVVHTNEVQDSIEAQRSQEIGYVMLSHRGKNGMASMRDPNSSRNQLTTEQGSSARSAIRMQS